MFAIIRPMTEKNTEENQEQNEQVTQTYEVGYLLVPTIPEENIEEAESAIVDIIGQNGSVRSKDAPVTQTLAYRMEKKVKGKKHRFDSAYFGSIVFDASTVEIGTIKKALEEYENMLRFLTIKRSENSLVSGASKPKQIYQKKVNEEEKGKMDEVQVDSAIEEMVRE